MKKRRKGKVRWLSVLLTGCLLLSIIPATAFAAEDTVATESKNMTVEAAQTSGQEDTAEEGTTEKVTSITNENTNDADDNTSDTYTDKKDITVGESKTSELQDVEKNTTDENGIGTSRSSYQHTYHTNIKVTANVTIQDKEGNTTTESIFKESGFMKGDVSDTAVQTQITDFKNAIKANYNSTWNFTEQNITTSLILDHFESNNILDSDGNDANTNLDIHEYQVYEIAYDLIVQEPDAVDEVITTVDIGNVWKNLDSSQPVAFTAEVNPNSECANQMTLTNEYWQHMVIDGGRIDKFNPQKPIAGETYSYTVKLTAKDGYYFHDGFKGSGIECTVICDGSTTTAYSGTLSDDRKQLTLWLYDIKVTATDGSSKYSIGDVDIEGVTFNYEPGDVPKATAYKYDPWDEQYDIEYEYWEEMETNANGESVPVKYWYSDESKNNALAQDKRITTFEDGKTYMYSLSLKARDGNTFAANSNVMVNGTNVNNANVTNTGTGLFAVAVKTIKPQTIQNISVIEINNATIAFKDGDKPVFTGNVPDNEDYAFRCEWWSLDSNTGLVSTEPEWGSEIYKNKITTFEAGKTYHYGVYVTAYYGTFSPDAKLKINGQYVNYKRVGDDDNMQSMWLETDLTMTPTASGTTPEYKITEGANSSWKQNSDDTLKFVANGDFSKFTGVKVDGTLVAADKYTAVSGSTVITLKKDYLSTLSVGKHTLTIVYNDGECSTEFEIKTASTISGINNPGNNLGNTSSKVNKSDTSKTTSPKTGDTSNMILWLIVLLASGSVTISTMMVYRKKKYNR